MRRPSEAIRGHQKASEAIRSHHRPSEAIRSHQKPSEAIRRPSEAIRGHQKAMGRPSEAIRSNQRPSEAIRSHQKPSAAIRGNSHWTEIEPSHAASKCLGPPNCCPLEPLKISGALKWRSSTRSLLPRKRRALDTCQHQLWWQAARSPRRQPRQQLQQLQQVQQVAAEAREAAVAAEAAAAAGAAGAARGMRGSSWPAATRRCGQQQRHWQQGAPAAATSLAAGRASHSRAPRSHCPAHTPSLTPPRILGRRGNQWQSMATNGSQWQPMAANGSQWQPMAANGSQWQSMAPGGSEGEDGRHILRLHARRLLAGLRAQVHLHACAQHGSHHVVVQLAIGGKQRWCSLATHGKQRQAAASSGKQR